MIPNVLHLYCPRTNLWEWADESSASGPNGRHDRTKAWAILPVRDNSKIIGPKRLGALIDGCVDGQIGTHRICKVQDDG